MAVPGALSHGLPRAAAGHLDGKNSLDSLIELAGGASFVLLGEASHGTHDFYATRIEITRRLIGEKSFRAVAVEADWPDAHRVNRDICGLRADATAERALSEFTRFPVWIWRGMSK